MVIRFDTRAMKVDARSASPRALRQRSITLGVIVLGHLLLTSTAMAQAWTGAGSDDDWRNPANWSGGAVPTVNATNAVGDISLTGSSALGAFTLGAAGTTPSLTVSNGGSLSMYGALTVAPVSGNRGVLTVTGAGSSVNTSNYFMLRGGGDATVEQGGYLYGNISYIGENSGTAKLTVRGAGAEFETFMLSMGAFGAAEMTIADGGRVTSTFSTIGEYGGSSGVLTITGANSVLSSPTRLYVGGAGSGVINLGSAQGATASEAGQIAGSQIIFGTSGGSGTLVFNHTGSAYDFYLPMATGSSGSANRILQVAGTTLLSGDSSLFNGTTNVSGGSLRVNNKLGGTVNVSGGSLGGTGQLLGNVTVASGGTLAPGNSIGTVNVAGNVGFSTGSTLAVEVDAAGNADKLLIGGTATIITGANVAVSAASGTYAPQTSYTILSAAGGITGMFGVTTDHYFLTPTLALSGNDLVLTMSQSTNPAKTVASLAGTSNQRASGSVIDGMGAGSEVYDAFLSLNEADARQLLSSATGEAHAASQQVIDQTFGQFKIAIGKRQNQASSGTGETSAPLGYVARPQTAANTGIAEATNDTAMPALAYWLAPVAAIGRNDSDGMGGAVNWMTGGLTLGGDGSVALEDGSAYAGLALGYLRSQAKSSASTVTTDSGQVGAYGRVEAGALHVSGSLAYGLAQGRTSRTISGGGINHIATSTAFTHSLGGTVELAYAYEVASGMILTPMVGLDTSISHRGASQESGAGAFDLAIAASTLGQLDPSVGIGIEQQFSSAAGMITARAALAWQHSLLDAPEQSLRFVGSNASFSLAGRGPEQDRLRLDLGLTLTAGERTHIFGDYGGRFAAGSQDHSARFGIKSGF